MVPIILQSKPSSYSGNSLLYTAFSLEFILSYADSLM